MCVQFEGSGGVGSRRSLRTPLVKILRRRFSRELSLLCPFSRGAMTGGHSVKECRRASASILWYPSEVARDYLHRLDRFR